MILDGDRKTKYFKDHFKNDYFKKIKKEILKQAKNYNIHVIDMHPIFKKHYEINKKWFEIKNEGHWNKLGHELAAKSFANKI